MDGLISSEDLNCAVSKPNALYGTRYNPKLRERSTYAAGTLHSPTVALYQLESGPQSFQLHALKVKPLSMPLGHAKLVINGTRIDHEVIGWEVDFPAGFSEMLEVDLATFSNQTWEGLQSFSIYADFYNANVVMDWEFCLDDLVVSFNQ